MLLLPFTQFLFGPLPWSFSAGKSNGPECAADTSLEKGEETSEKVLLKKGEETFEKVPLTEKGSQ